MTNMMFAGPQTKVFEIGHGQTIERWRTFHPMAAVAGCRYEAFFADYANDRPTERPDLRKDGFPVPDCTPQLVDAVMARVDAFAA
jgi:capsular polysaccharide biosynthesis protein